MQKLEITRRCFAEGKEMSKKNYNTRALAGARVQVYCSLKPLE